MSESKPEVLEEQKQDGESQASVSKKQLKKLEKDKAK